jgi:hypothetical protein
MPTRVASHGKESSFQLRLSTSPIAAPPYELSASDQQPSTIRVARFFLTQYTKNRGKYTKQSKNYPVSIKKAKLPWNPICHKIYQTNPFQGPPKFTQTGFGVVWNYAIWQPCLPSMPGQYQQLSTLEIKHDIVRKFLKGTRKKPTDIPAELQLKKLQIYCGCSWSGNVG